MFAPARPSSDMAGRVIRGVRACAFDAYGTLFDLNSATAPFLAELGAKADSLNRVWREKQLQYSWLRAAQTRHADFWQVTADALDFALDSLSIDDARLRDRLMQSYLILQAYPEVRDVLDRLRATGLRLAILSNGTPEMLRSAVEHAGLAGLFDAVLSVEEVGIFKPHRRVYQLAVDRLGLPADGITFVSANAWDAYAASASGLRVVWCNRFGSRAEHLPGNPDMVLTSLAELPSRIASAG
jgi:2-haloacid dehalogenase